MRSTEKLQHAIRTIFGRLNLFKAGLLLLAAAAFVSSVAVTVTSQTGFCNSCHIMDDYYASWEKSSHSDVSCLSCHLRPGFTGYLKGKINGLAQAVDCIVGRVGTQAQATVLDQSCLRSACHSEEDLLDKEIAFESVRFTHEGHIGREKDGIALTCGTCHNHTHGEEHFSVNKEVCYTCHFVRSEPEGDGLVQSRCLDCHEVPSGVIDRGLVTIDHQAFESYNVNCENSCHKRQIEHVSRVDDTACLHCHTFIGSDEYTSEELHARHTEAEKVECFACHGKVTHGPDATSSVATMIHCENCHSDTHAVQQTIFSADQQPHGPAVNERVLSPMFLTHVECTGCHVDRNPTEGNALDSLGTVARATPQACDSCHEAGTGRRYIPFWQESIRQLYQQVLRQAERTEPTISGFDEKTKRASVERISRVRSILESVRADGSWGVHNLKYTESLLLEAKRLLTEIESGVK